MAVSPTAELSSIVWITRSARPASNSALAMAISARESSAGTTTKPSCLRCSSSAALSPHVGRATSDDIQKFQIVIQIQTARSYLARLKAVRPVPPGGCRPAVGYIPGSRRPCEYAYVPAWHGQSLPAA